MTINDFKSFLFLMGFADEYGKGTSVSAAYRQYGLHPAHMPRVIRVFINDDIDRITNKPNKSKINIFWGVDRKMESFSKKEIPQAQEKILELLSNDKTGVH